MKPRHLRLLGLLAMLSLLALAGGLGLRAFQRNLVFFVTPSDIARGDAPAGTRFRLGGLVAPGSVQREGNDIRFTVTDGAQAVVVSYRGPVPDLFREGKGVVAQGRLAGLQFVADEVLAKHDENYMPPELKPLAQSLAAERGSAWSVPRGDGDAFGIEPKAHRQTGPAWERPGARPATQGQPVR